MNCLHRLYYYGRPLPMLLAMILIFINVYSQSASNDHIFPPSPAAKPFIDFDNKGFLVNGKRTFLVSGGLEYARIPRALWYDRLLRLKRCGFNCIEIYTMWNFHEAREAHFNFSGDHDLNFFLKLVHQLGMYAIVRVGPYYCAEWDNGGYPLWLRFKKDLRVREHNAAFEKYVDRFFDTLLPIVTRNQINHGGAVIMVQLENEHPEGWGTVIPNEYFRHLQTKALSLGLQVPYFFSGLHHSSDPAGDGLPDDSTRPNPWFSTEFWSVWFSQYGSDSADARVFERRTWKIIAHGGNGYNYYMAHGGSNFGYTNNDEDAASYDYGAAVGQTGDLRPIYYTFKRAALFARSFSEILENSTDATNTYKQLITDTAVHLNARHSNAGDLVFLDNPATLPVQTTLTGIGTQNRLTLSPGEIMPVVHHYALTQNIMLEWAPVRILGTCEQGNTTTIAVYGNPGTTGELQFITTGKTIVSKGNNSFTISGSRLNWQTTFTNSNQPAEYSFSTGAKRVRILALSSELADRTWFITIGKQTHIICGPAYAGDCTMNTKHISIVTEQPWQNPRSFPTWIYDANTGRLLKANDKSTVARKTTLPLAAWEAQEAASAAEPDYRDENWKHSEWPLPMGADGDTTADAWYRSTVNIPSDGMYTLQAEGSDRAIVFIDGKRTGEGDIKKGELLLPLQAGKHTLAVFTAHDGRDKLAAYIGAIDSTDNKGLFGKTVIKKGGPFISTLNNWYFIKAGSAQDVQQGPPVFDSIHSKKYSIGEDAFALHEGFGWFQTVLPVPEGASQMVLQFKSVDENATVFINGHQLAKHEGWNQPFTVSFQADTLKAQAVLSVFIQNYSNEGGIDKPVRLNTIGHATPVTGWRMRGGTGECDLSSKGWHTFYNNDLNKGVPCFFRSHFNVPSLATGSHPVWRITTNGLSHGSIWVNGHNLGRYPEKIPVNGLYIPECWLKPGTNSVVIYDEEGHVPAGVSIQAEMAASRNIKICESIN